MNGTLMDARLLDDLVEGGGGVLAGRSRYPWEGIGQDSMTS